MRYPQVQDKKPAEFKRLVGVSKETFSQMHDTLEAAKPTRGRPPVLPLCDQLLLTLMYLREYRTMAHIALAYGVSEPTAFRAIRKVEDTLLKSGTFSLPGKKVLMGEPIELSVLIVDSFETPIERPKKNSATSSAARRSVTP
jgi:hypothetical protein